jgi:hypothetical protein
MTRKGAVKFKTDSRSGLGPKNVMSRSPDFKPSVMAPGGVRHGLEQNPDAVGELLAQIEAQPFQLVRRGTADDGRGCSEIARYTELAGWGQSLSLCLARYGRDTRATCDQKPDCRSS